MQTFSKQNFYLFMLSHEMMRAKLAEIGWTHAEIGRKLGVSGQRIGQYLSGKRNPKQDFIDKWNRLFSETNVSRETNKIPLYDRILKRIEKGTNGSIIAMSYDPTYSAIEIPIEKIKRLFMVLGKIEFETSI